MVYTCKDVEERHEVEEEVGHLEFSIEKIEHRF